MYYVKFGEGKPVVYLHGWGCDGSIFAPVAKLLPNFSNYLVDFNGFGKSDPPCADGWTVWDYARELHDFLMENNLRKVALVGHSFGCRVGLCLAAKYPDDVSKMLFVAPAGLRKFSLRRWWRVRIYKLKKRFGKTDLSYAGKDYLDCRDEMKKTFVKVVNEDLSAVAKKVRCPVLIVNGREDESTPLRHAERLNKLLRDSNLTIIDGGHFSFFFVPAAFAQTVKIFAE